MTSEMSCQETCFEADFEGNNRKAVISNLDIDGIIH